MANPVCDHLDARERKILAALRSPARIQRFLDEEVSYNKEPDGATCHPPRIVLSTRVAHCVEGAMFAAMALRLLGHPPLLVDLEAVRDADHVVAAYRVDGHWGALGMSDYSGLRSREPVYKTVRELALSYFEHYYNPQGEKTLRAYSRPVNLARFDRTLHWMTTLEQLWAIPNYLCEIPHARIVPKHVERNLSPMDRRLYAAGRIPSAVSITPRRAAASTQITLRQRLRSR